MGLSSVSRCDQSVHVVLVLEQHGPSVRVCAPPVPSHLAKGPQRKTPPVWGARGKQMECEEQTLFPVTQARP
ncbi:MAG: hypothetical protein RLZZ458_3689, partial [Planctomycetota bacterium]